jgi:adenylate cyclase
VTIAGPPIAPSTPADGASRILRLDDVERCFEGAIPAVVATASADGVPNVIYVSRAHRVDDERIALSNQFLSKTARNIAVNPRASVLLVDPLTHDEYRLSIVYERTERRGPVFERLRTDIDALAALVGMTGVFRLRAADIFRVLELEQVPPNTVARPAYRPATRRSSPELSALAELARRVSRSGDVDSVIETALSGLGELFGYQSCRLLLLDEDTGRLRFVAGPGPESQAVEVEIGHGVIGMAAERCQTMRVGNLGQILKYSRSVRSQYEQAGVSGLTELSGPHESGVESVVAAPLQALGQLLGVLASPRAPTRRRSVRPTSRC